MYGEEDHVMAICKPRRGLRRNQPCQQLSLDLSLQNGEMINGFCLRGPGSAICYAASSKLEQQQSEAKTEEGLEETQKEGWSSPYLQTSTNIL